MVKARVKRFLRKMEDQEGARPLTEFARQVWYRWKNLSDRVGFPALRQSLVSGAPDAIEDRVAFVFDNHGGVIAPIQSRYEITEFLQRVRARRPRAVLEIGTAKGGTLCLLCGAAADDAVIVSLDLPYARNGGGFPRWKEPTYRLFSKAGQRLELLRGDSHAVESRDRVRDTLDGRPIDLLMIDGDHSYRGVRADFEMYAPLMAADGIIAIHDIVENRFDPSIDVHRFWRELAQRYETEEIVETPHRGAFGIGLVWPGRAIAS